MSEHSTVTVGLAEAIAAQDWDRLEELWLAAIAEPVIPTRELLEARRELARSGDSELAMTLLELLVEALEERDDSAAAVTALCDLVRLAKPADPDLVRRLERAFKDSRAGCPSLQLVLDRFRLADSRRPIETVETMARWLDYDRGTIVEVIGQGVGRVADLNLELESVKVDLGAKRPVSVPFAAVPRFLRLLPAGDFRRRVVEDPAAAREQLTTDPGGALVALLESLREPADVATIKGALEGLLGEPGWTAWWGKARAHPRILTSGSGSRLRYSASGSAESASGALLKELESTSPRERLVVARRLASRGDEPTAAAVAVLSASLAELERADPGLAWETATLLAELPGGAGPAADSKGRLLAETRPLQLLSTIRDRGARAEVLSAVRGSSTGDWRETWGEWLLHEEHPALLATMASELMAAGADDELDGALEVVFRNHLEHAAQFVWACEAMTEPGCPEPVRRRLTPSLLEKLPDALTRPEFAPLRSRAKTLLDGGQAAVRLLLDSATGQQAERFVARMARISSLEPQRMRVLEQAAQHARGSSDEPHEPLLAATREAVAAKRAELKQLLEIEIPKTLQRIQAAAAEGDLRENFEYHMLRDRQELQSARAAALQRDLETVRIIDPGASDTSRVNIGTVVHMSDPEGAPIEPVTILGPWDADPSRRIYASSSDLARNLLGRQVGDDVEVEGQQAVVREIAAWTGQR